jgi:GT2 family glycosyltransferase
MNPGNNSVCAVVLNWNNYDDTTNCLDSLDQLESTPHVIVVDNGSDDGSGQTLATEYGWAEFVFLDENRGFSGGINAGIRTALERESAYVWLVNNDFVVRRPDFLDRLRAPLERHEEFGIVSPTIYCYPDMEKVWFEYGLVDRRSFNATHSRWKQAIMDLRFDDRSYRSFTSRFLRNDYVPFCSALVDRAVFESIGFLREDYFLYYEDVDFCLRAKDAEFEIVTDTELRGFHRVSGSVSGNATRGYYNARNRVLLARRHGATGPTFFVFLAWWTTLLIAASLVRGDVRKAYALSRGCFDGVTGSTGRGPYP